MLDRILRSPKLSSFSEALKEGRSILVEELWNSPKALLATLAVQAAKKNVLIVTGQSLEETRLYHDFSFFSDIPVIDFPAWETLPSENIAPSPDIVGERYQALADLKKIEGPAIIIANLQACLQKLIDPAKFYGLNRTLTTNLPLSFSGFQEELIQMGYKKVSIASDKGEFAVRGGIIDVFPVSRPDPYRLEFFGDELESIRTYDPIGQRSISRVDKLEFTPALELEMIEGSERLASLLDYLGKDTIVVLDDLLQLEDRWASLKSLLEKPLPSFQNVEEFFHAIEPLQKIFLTSEPIEELSEVKSHAKGYYSQTSIFSPIKFEAFARAFEADRFHHPFEGLSAFLYPELESVTGQEILYKTGSLKDYNLDFLTSSDVEEENLKRQIENNKVHLPVHTHFGRGYLSSGFVIPEIMEAVIPMTEITHRYKIRRQKHRSTYHVPASEFYELVPGELVVHFHNGIGKYIGLEKKPNHEGIFSEYFLIEYADQAKLYVPLNQAHLITKYVGSQDEVPKLHGLGSNKWRNLKEKTQTAIMGYASDLLKMYAEREIKGGFAYRPDSEEMLAFEEEFPYVETEDQLAAIRDIKEAMMSPKAMDRLVCGDVGYGKTEVAMRAAFKAVVDGGKQVAVLVPTTVLAMQHYENFVARMENFPVNISVLSRFRTPKEIRETLKQAADGQVDIIIGTHRIISEDVKFKDLGLVIIDEEQRFGVKAKEHLKKIKTGVDCLTLSATPIPRTLYMSLIGARDMSIISTPPQDRLPIKTIMAEPADQLIKTALLRELARDGQAYVIHNRVDTIFGVADRVKKLLPQARVVVGHGQMSEQELDEVFHAFKQGRADILIATTIVENGIDIPNANTILIDRADHFGLAALYQLRGRVGRWNRRAYAYFLVKNLRVLSEPSRRRLQALSEASGYGGGMKLAMRDLEIRGGGNIIGEEQSGHISSIGFHLYCKLLKRTVQALQGKMPAILTDTKIDIPIDARLPEEYIDEVTIRMEFYQKLGEVLSFPDLENIFAELKDRFGPFPRPVLWLYHFSRVRLFASLNGFTHLKAEKTSLLVTQKKGREEIQKRALFTVPKNPQDFEDKLLALLKKEFKTR